MKYKKRRIAQFFLSAVGIYIISLLMPGFYIDNFFSAIILTFSTLLLTFLFWPLLLRITKRFLFVSFIIGSFLTNVLVLWLANMLLPGVVVSGWDLLTVALTVDFVSAVVTVVLNIDDDDIYARSIYYQLKRKMEKVSQNNKPGFVFLAFDGLSETVLKKAIQKGKMPTLASWISKGSHKIKGWETDLSSQTSSGQAGILHGCNIDIPAFRWVDKTNNNKILSSNSIGDAPSIQERISDGNGLLSNNGAAITNLFTGDSKDNILVYSTLKSLTQFYSESWNAFYSKPFNGAHVIVLSFFELLLEIKSRFRQWRKHVTPRLSHRGRFSYFLARAGANVVLREISTYVVIGGVISGEKDVIYTTYYGYDEIAHHYGAEDDESFTVLEKLDRQVARIEASLKYGKRPYYLCILSDHGQTNGATFKQRYGLTLDKFVKHLLSEKEVIYQILNSDQEYFNQMIAPRYRAKFNLKSAADHKKLRDANVIVLSSGNLGLIYFTKSTQRMTLEEINIDYPGIIEGLLSHEGIGFIMVSSKLGGVVLGKEGRYFLANDGIEGNNPLTKFGLNAAAHLRRTDSFKYTPDILVMSMYDIEKEEVAAFEELIGSHGGLGGDQNKPFILYPSDWNLYDEAIVGAEKVHKLLKRQITS